MNPGGDVDSPSCKTSALEGKQGLPAPASCRSQPGRKRGKRYGEQGTPSPASPSEQRDQSGIT